MGNSTSKCHQIKTQWMREVIDDTSEIWEFLMLIYDGYVKGLRTRSVLKTFGYF